MSHSEDSSPQSERAVIVPTTPQEKRASSWVVLVVWALAIAHVVANRLAWSGIPLQTDTGMWAYIGARILDGALPYRDLWESKPPGIYYVFAVVEWLSGVGRDGGLLWLDAVVSTVVLVVTYRVARRFASRLAAAGAILLLSIVFCHRILADWGDNVEKFVALFEMLACGLVLTNWTDGGCEKGFSHQQPDGGREKGFSHQFHMSAALAIADENRSPGASPSRERSGEGMPVRAPAPLGQRFSEQQREDPTTSRGTLSVQRKAAIRWLLAGVCCGLAALFKQTGVLFLLVATCGAASLVRCADALVGRLPVGAPAPHARRPQGADATPPVASGLPNSRKATTRHSRATAVGLLWLGALLPWLPVVGWMLVTGIFEQFWQQVVLYDFLRIGSGESERSRLLTGQHWADAWGTLKIGTLLFGPALLGVMYWLHIKRRHRDAPAGAPAAAPLWVVVLYAAAVVAAFGISPYGYGHYLLQAAPPAAVVLAWFFSQMRPPFPPRIWRYALVAMGALGVWLLRDHLEFTARRDNLPREAYRLQAEQVRTFVRLIDEHTRPGESVMLWPTDCSPGSYAVPTYAMMYYARRVTPLEASNSDVIFKGKIGRLRPPMPRLVDQLRARPPDVILDWTPVMVMDAVAGRGDVAAEPRIGRRAAELHGAAAGFSLWEEPDDNHPWREGRELAPLKRWIRGAYGGQQRVGPFTIFRRGEPWQPWQDVLLPRG